MDIETAERYGNKRAHQRLGPQHSVLDRANNVCYHWLAGRCTRHPCRFLHSDPAQQPSGAPSASGPANGAAKRNLVWRNPNAPGGGPPSKWGRGRREGSAGRAPAAPPLRMGLATKGSAAAASPEPAAAPLTFLIYGRTGWIGGLLGRLCEDRGIAYTYGNGRLENRAQLEADIEAARPTHVFNAAGVTGLHNVDWCETHRTETVRANVAGTLTLADVCRERGLVLVNYATGCIFEYDEAHPPGSGVGFKEEDKPNFTGTFYSKTKAMVEKLLRNYENVCTLRVRMPISSDLANPRNFITKITHYGKVVNIPNSMTILDELLPISIEMAIRNLTGIWNFTNPGVVSHNEILEMYRDYIDPSFTWENFTLEDQAKVVVAPRSNNELDTTKLQKEFPDLLPIKESLIKYVLKPNQKTARKRRRR